MDKEGQSELNKYAELLVGERDIIRIPLINIGVDVTGTANA